MNGEDHSLTKGSKHQEKWSPDRPVVKISMESSQQSAQIFAGVGIPLSNHAIKFPFKTLRI
jgi:hypothetical protein